MIPINDKPHTIFRYQRLMDKERNRLSPGKRWIDRTGILISALCFLHCWSMPLILLAFPELIYGESFVHPVLGGLAVFSAVLFVRNYARKEHQKIIWMALPAGIFMILLPLFLPHTYLSHSSEITLNTVGSFLLIFVHYSNYRSRTGPLRRSPSGRRLESAGPGGRYCCNKIEGKVGV